MKCIKQKAAYLILLLSVTACSSVHTLDNRVTESIHKDASVGQEYQVAEDPFRFWADESTDFLFSEATQTTPLTVKGDALNVLVLSGGGAKGAFGAGVLNGLNDNGSLEDYSIITGVSAGALIAPFAFIGGDELTHLKHVMLGINDKAIIGKRNFLNTVFKDAFTDGGKMYEFIASVYTAEMIEKIASEHRSGRRLFVGTTQFDSEKLTVWNIGSIANSDMSNKVELIQQVLVASSSIPGVFPPQFIKVDYKGEQYEELHVDGGMAAQMFFEPMNTDYHKVSQSLGLTEKPNIHVIRNGMLAMPYEAMPDKGIALLTRSLKSLTVLQSRGDLYKMLYFSEQQQLNLGFTYVESEFNAPSSSKNMFDPEYMKALYQYGYKKGATGQPWESKLP